MFARSTAFRTRPDRVTHAVTYVRDAVMPVISCITGQVGLSMLADRGSGRGIVTTTWQSAEVMCANAQRIRPLREQATEILGSSMQVDEWQIAALRRVQPADRRTCVRVTWIRLDPRHVDRAVDAYERTSLPAMESLEGFCSASLFVNPASGRAVSSVAYDGPEAMARHRGHGSIVVTNGVPAVGADVLDVAEFALVLARLHVPDVPDRASGNAATA